MDIQDQKWQIQQINKINNSLILEYRSTTFIERISFMIIRPPRVLYNQQILKLNKRFAKKYNQRIQYIPFPLSIYEPPQINYIILYLHGNSSNRIEGFNQICTLPEKVGLACFDFDGCGNRVHKRYISVGKYQSKEVDIAYNYLKAKGYTVVCWGRSMGSVSALLSQSCDIIVADSPFASLKRLCQQFIYSQLSCLWRLIFKSCLFSILYFLVCKHIQQKANIKLQDFDIITSINNKNRFIIFLSGTQDTLISYKHSQDLFQTFQGPKKIYLVDGDHNSKRPYDVLCEIHQQINHFIIENKQKALAISSQPNQQKCCESRQQFNSNKQNISEKVYHSENDSHKNEQQKQLQQIMSTSLMVKCDKSLNDI